MSTKLLGVFRDDLVESHRIELARFVNPEAADNFLSRGNDYERINFRGNVLDPLNKAMYSNQFFALDVEDVFNENFVPELVKVFTNVLKAWRVR